MKECFHGLRKKVGLLVGNLHSIMSEKQKIFTVNRKCMCECVYTMLLLLLLFDVSVALSVFFQSCLAVFEQNLLTLDFLVAAAANDVTPQ